MSGASCRVASSHLLSRMASTMRRTISTFSSDIAHAVSRSRGPLGLPGQVLAGEGADRRGGQAPLGHHADRRRGARQHLRVRRSEELTVALSVPEKSYAKGLPLHYLFDAIPVGDSR